MTTAIKEVIKEIPFFKETEKKEDLLFLVGALTLRLISLKRASEIMEMDTESLLKLLDYLGVDYSYLEREDIEIERKIR